MKTSSLVLAVFAAALVAGAGGVAAWKSGMFGGAEQGQPMVGGPFQMTDQDGKRVDQSLLKGKWTAVFFGYTFCPEACPTTLTTLAKAQEQLGPKSKDLQVVFVSVDPARDTPAQLKTYLSSQSFPKGTVGLTGSATDVAKAAKAYKVFYQKSGTGPDYAMKHYTAH